MLETPSKPTDGTPAPYTGYTLEELDQFGDLDSLPYSLDSEVWKHKPAQIPAAKPQDSKSE